MTWDTDVVTLAREYYGTRGVVVLLWDDYEDTGTLIGAFRSNRLARAAARRAVRATTMPKACVAQMWPLRAKGNLRLQLVAVKGSFAAAL